MVRISCSFRIDVFIFPLKCLQWYIQKWTLTCFCCEDRKYQLFSRNTSRVCSRDQLAISTDLNYLYWFSTNLQRTFWKDEEFFFTALWLSFKNACRIEYSSKIHLCAVNWFQQFYIIMKVVPGHFSYFHTKVVKWINWNKFSHIRFLCKSSPPCSPNP